MGIHYFALSLFTKERQEQIAHVALFLKSERAILSFWKSDSFFLKKRFSLFERTILFFWKSDSLFMTEQFSLFERAILSLWRAILSLWKSDSFFMKEWFALFRSGLCSFLKRKLKKIFIHTYCLCFLKKPKRVYHSF